MELDQHALHRIGRKFLVAYSARFPKVEAHEADDPEGSDHFWLSVEEHDLSEGELIGLSPLGGDRWYAHHDLAHKYGGWPTVWYFSGTEAEVLDAVARYLDSRG